MTKQSPFHPRFDQLTPTIPVFPLPGVLLLPGGLLPLNIFEPRYIAMVDAALGAGRLIGMVQPEEASGTAQGPKLYRSGCAGRITSFEETDDGRYLITLAGVCRFDIAEELEMAQGFRRIRADWDAFADDLLPSPDGALFCRDRLQKALGTYFDKHGIAANPKAIDAASDECLVTSLCMICPFQPAEKQALLEARTWSERAEMMLSLIEMAVLNNDQPQARH